MVDLVRAVLAPAEAVAKHVHHAVVNSIVIPINACADLHPKRKDYYINHANKLGLTPPTFIEPENYSYKIVSSEKLKKRLDYKYKFPDPFEIDDD